MPHRTGSATFPSMAAKVDSAAVQDSFDIYHHSFFLSSDVEGAVVQQGMPPVRR